MSGLFSFYSPQQPVMPSALAALGGQLFPEPDKWLYTGRRFQRFLANIEPTDLQKEDVWAKASGIVSSLNNHYWAGKLQPGEVTYIVAGSWLKGTRVRLSSDLDIIFLMPWEMAVRYAKRQGNRQSDILQEIKNVLQWTYPETLITSDGPAVILHFKSYKVEVIPAFLDPHGPKEIHKDLKVWVCETKNDGRYKPSAPIAEYLSVATNNNVCSGELVALIRMAKSWKRHCNVPIKSLYLQELAIEFLAQWEQTGKGWYDWMARDYFAYMISRCNGFAFMPLTNEAIFFGSDWLSRAETAYKRAETACTYEQDNWDILAGVEWQKIFGNNIPMVVA